MSSPAFILAITTAIQAIVSLSSVAVPVLAPAAAGDLGISLGAIGYFISIMYVGAATAALVSGGLILRFGSIRVSQVCLALCGVALLLLTQVPQALIPLAAVLLGCGYGPITPASSHVLARTTPAHLMALTFSIKQTGVPLGAMLAGLIVPPLTLGFGWRAAALCVAALCILMAGAAQVLRRELDADRNPAHPISAANFTRPFGLIFTNPALIRNVMTATAFAGLQLSFFTFVVAYLTESLAYTLVAAGFALSFANVGGVGGRIVWGWIADRTRNPRVILGILGVSMTAAALATAAFTPAWPYGAVLAVCLLFGITAVGWNGVQISETARLSPPGMAAVVAGGSTFITFTGIIVMPALFAVTRDATGNWGIPFVLVCLPALLMGVVQLMPARR
jgi:MFS family permease